MSALAINGGEKVRERPFPAYRVIGDEEAAAAQRVIRTGTLSKFLGTWHKDFYGGPEVQALEKEWAEYFGVKHAISVNSCTSGLYCAVGAVGIGPGDEVIVSPYTMSASATSILVFNGIPVFADIENDFFCLDPESVEKRITPNTKAILVVDIFGLPYDSERINAIAKKHGLKVIEDNAQAPGAKYKGKFAGTLGDIGVFSLNYHKHIHSGEGGIVVTDDDQLAEKVRLIRNHAEAVLHAKGYSSPAELINMIGFNFRMTELEAAISREQLKKLGGLVEARIRNVDRLAKRLSALPGIEPARVRQDCSHVYYVHPIKFDEDIVGIPRNKFVQAVKAELPLTELREDEGVLIGCGYVKPLYMEPLYQNLMAYGDKGCPFSCQYYTGKADYSEGICPVTERMHFKELITHELIRPPMTEEDIDNVAAAFEKVYSLRGEIPL